MSSIVSQGPCPRCASSDAYTEYDDGGTHCFSCGLHTPGNAYKKLLGGATVTQKKLKLSLCPPLPGDAARLLGWGIDGVFHVVDWLQRYGITHAEMDEYQFLYSPEKRYLIFPVYDPNGNLVMWQARYFGDNPSHPKYITRGVPADVLHILGRPSDSIVLVEDLLSAIKVSRVAAAMPLWGSHISANLIQRISLEYSSAILWLDYDKRVEAVEMAIGKAIPIKVVITKHDPKMYNDIEIQGFLRNSAQGAALT